MQDCERRLLSLRLRPGKRWPRAINNYPRSTSRLGKAVSSTALPTLGFFNPCPGRSHPAAISGRPRLPVQAADPSAKSVCPGHVVRWWSRWLCPDPQIDVSALVHRQPFQLLSHPVRGGGSPPLHSPASPSRAQNPGLESPRPPGQRCHHSQAGGRRVCSGRAARSLGWGAAAFQSPEVRVQQRRG